MQTMRHFTRRVEDFACGHCGTTVQGDGFTNHCPQCLWSQHVDRFPGDRAVSCGGLMEPVALDRERGVWKITHRCQQCGARKKNKSQHQDESESLVRLARVCASRQNKQ